MAKFTWSKAKLSRKLWINVFWLPKIDKIIAKRSTKWKTSWSWKKSEFWVQQKEKQILRYTFWLSEKQLRKYYDIAIRSKNITSEELVRQIEIRVDNIVYRAWFAKSRSQARQMISHGHFEFNWQKITVPSIQIRPWDKLSVTKKLQTSPLFSDISSLEKWLKWIKSDTKKKEIVIDSLPESDELEQSIKTHLIVEYYSRK